MCENRSHRPNVLLLFTRSAGTVRFDLKKNAIVLFVCFDWHLFYLQKHVFSMTQKNIISAGIQ